MMPSVKKYPEVVFDKVILFGSILNPETDLEIFFRHNQVNEILHEIGNSDSAVKWSRWVLGDEAGNSGEIGFKFIPAELRHRIKEVPYTDFEHGSADFCLHMQQAWVPFLIKPKFLYDAAILRPDILNYIYIKNRLLQISSSNALNSMPVLMRKVDTMATTALKDSTRPIRASPHFLFHLWQTVLM
jgi:hypothetical protein